MFTCRGILFPVDVSNILKMCLGQTSYDLCSLLTKRSLIITCDIWLSMFIKAKKSWFWGYAPKRDNKNEPCATKIKNITPVVY